MQKLTKDQQMQLIHEYAHTAITQNELATKYNITTRQVRNIVKGVRRYRDHSISKYTWREPATKETEGGNQKFHRNYKEYSFYEDDNFWKIQHEQRKEIYLSQLTEYYPVLPLGEFENHE